MGKHRIGLIVLLALSGSAVASAQQVSVRVGPGLLDGPVTGRAFVIFSRQAEPEPRFEAGAYNNSVPFFGVDVSEMPATGSVTIDGGALGFPLASLRDVPAGEYYVQALLVKYTKVTPKHGKTIWVAWDQWEGRHWNRTPGNLISAPERVRWDPTAKLSLTLTAAIPPVEVPPDTKWVKRVKIQSKMLSEWWGRPVYLGATVLLPRGFDENPSTKYPAIYIQGHFGLGAPFGFDPDGRPESADARVRRLERTSREPGYEFAQAWMGPDLPRMVAITFQHPTPYYDDSYVVNSANQGPYQDAIIEELIPYLEQKFRLISESRARFLTGGSTGGWEALALQIHRPRFFGGTWSLYPDGVDFTRNQMINNYADTNAFLPNTRGPNDWMPRERYMSRGEDGQPGTTVREMARLEEVLGTRVRGGQQLQAYDASYGPVAEDGYPKPLFDRHTGTIDKSVAAYWRDNGYDLNYYLEKHWAEIGPDLDGKIHVYVGDMDNYYLNLGVYEMEKTMKRLGARAVFEYGRPMKPHGWQPFTNAELVGLMARQMERARAIP